MRMNPTDRVHPDCKNFKWYEVWKSETASRLEIDNESEEMGVQEKAVALTLNVLQPIADEHGSTKVNSWFRGEPLEKVITKKSFKNWCKRKALDFKKAASWAKYFLRKSHPKGAAADIEVPSISNDDLYDWIADNLEYDQLIREFPVKGIPDSGWVHVSWAGDKNRKQKFTIGAK
jgi:hypothetical protein